MLARSPPLRSPTYPCLTPAPAPLDTPQLAFQNKVAAARSQEADSMAYGEGDMEAKVAVV